MKQLLLFGSFISVSSSLFFSTRFVCFVLFLPLFGRRFWSCFSKQMQILFWDFPYLFAFMFFVRLLRIYFLGAIFPSAFRCFLLFIYFYVLFKSLGSVCDAIRMPTFFCFRCSLLTHSLCLLFSFSVYIYS